MIEKPAVLVTSTGRTGTAFFADLFPRIVAECDAFHEPDCLKNLWPFEILDVLQQFGPVLATVDKLRLLGNVRGMSVARITGQVKDRPVASALERLRSRFVNSLCGTLYVESNQQMVGLIDVLPVVFRQCRIVYLVRDPREWLRSYWCHTGAAFSIVDLVSFLPAGRLRAPLCFQDPWAREWGEMDRFQKNCWLWAKKNRYALECVKHTDEARMWRFEDVFLGDRRYEVLEDLVDFATRFPDGTRFDHGSLEGVLERKVNESKRDILSPWREWSAERVRDFRKMCGGLMDELGYGEEPEWRRMCEEAGAP